VWELDLVKLCEEGPKPWVESRGHSSISPARPDAAHHRTVKPQENQAHLDRLTQHTLDVSQHARGKLSCEPGAGSREWEVGNGDFLF
jgi:hypothetical protein